MSSNSRILLVVVIPEPMLASIRKYSRLSEETDDFQCMSYVGCINTMVATECF